MNATDANRPEAPLLSITLPCHKQDPLLDRALTSCLPMAERPDVEIVVSWNSTDGEALGSFRKQYPGFRWYQPPQPLEMGANWDYCLQQARGRWCMVLSYDDVLLPDRLTAFLPTLAACDPGTGCVFGLCAEEDVWGSQTKLSLPVARGLRRIWRPGELWLHIPWGTPVHLPAALFRREVWRSAGGFDNGLAFACDAGLWERVCRQHAVLKVSDYWSIYRWHPYSKASTRAAREDWVRLALIYQRQLGTWDFLGRLLCRFGFSHQKYLAMKSDPEYHASVLNTSSWRDRIFWRGMHWMENTTIAGRPVIRVVSRVMLHLYGLIHHRLRPRNVRVRQE